MKNQRNTMIIEIGFYIQRIKGKMGKLTKIMEKKEFLKYNDAISLYWEFEQVFVTKIIKKWGNLHFLHKNDEIPRKISSKF